ncbi:hypothetical protein MMC22_001327 [Lobaria immixta]|nr:hypothetical protein [Lobaria immixta]
MADTTYAVDRSRQAKTRLEISPYELSEYEHLEVLAPMEERAGHRPVKLKRSSLHGGKMGEIGSLSGARILKTRKRRDGMIFRAAEYVDAAGMMDESKETLLRLLNHPNLINLVAIVQDAKVRTTSKSYTVWEDCNRGTLNRLLWHEPGRRQIDLPESLCWHVLDGISKALLWLHCGRKHTFPYDSDMNHDDDWQPITITELTPANIYFTASHGNETYGDVKLGGFRSARVHSSDKSTISIKPIWVEQNSAYMPPEVRSGTQGISAASDIWALGAVLYHMMVGEPLHQVDLSDETATRARDDFWVKALPKRFTSQLKEIVRSILSIDRDQRPRADELSANVDRGMRIWRQDTEDGRRFIAKGEHVLCPKRQQKTTTRTDVPAEMLNLGPPGQDN